MEIEFSSSSIFITFVLFLFLVLNIRKRSKNNGRTMNLPPGPWKLPVIGNLHQLPRSLPHHRFRDLARRYGPLMHLQIGEISTVIISSAGFAEEVMKTHDISFASRPYVLAANILGYNRPYVLAANILGYNSTDILFAPYGEYWRQVRKICTVELLSMKRVQSYRSIREEEVSNIIQWMASRSAGSPIYLTEKISSLSYGITTRAAFGKKDKDQEKYLSILGDASKLASGFNIEDLFPSIEGFLQWITGNKSKLEKMHHEADQILENIINEHRRDKATLQDVKNVKNEDLVDVLLKVQENGGAGFGLTIDNIKAVMGDIIGGGSETSATTINWAMSELMKNPTTMKKAQTEVREVFNRIGKVDETGIDEMKFLKVVIKETLRLHPPAALLPRECRERCEINGYGIPVKTKVIVNAWAIGRDPEYWSEPDNFIPERFLESSVEYKGNDFEYIPFGAGRRICPGISFGVANVELPLAMLLYHFDWKHPDGMKHEDLDMTEEFGISVRRKNDLWLIPISYHPSPTA